MTETSKFDSLAEVYATVRPDYPAPLFDMLEEYAGRPLRGADVADIGAGTGIASRQLRDRGARVTAVELSGPMLKELAAESPGVAAVQGSGNALPLRGESMDLVVSATAWHWVDPELAVPEVRRVLRPGGALACFWNIPVSTAGARQGYRERLHAALGGEPEIGTMNTGDRTFDSDGPSIALGSHCGPDLAVAEAVIPWSRWITVDQRLANIRSRSYVAGLPPERLEQFLEAERVEISQHARADGLIEEAYSAWLGVIRF